MEGAFFPKCIAVQYSGEYLLYDTTKFEIVAKYNETTEELTMSDQIGQSLMLFHNADQNAQKLIMSACDNETMALLSDDPTSLHPLCYPLVVSKIDQLGDFGVDRYFNVGEVGYIYLVSNAKISRGFFNGTRVIVYTKTGEVFGKYHPFDKVYMTNIEGRWTFFTEKFTVYSADDQKAKWSLHAPAPKKSVEEEKKLIPAPIDVPSVPNGLSKKKCRRNRKKRQAEKQKVEHHSASCLSSEAIETKHQELEVTPTPMIIAATENVQREPDQECISEGTTKIRKCIQTACHKGSIHLTKEQVEELARAIYFDREIGLSEHDYLRCMCGDCDHYPCLCK